MDSEEDMLFEDCINDFELEYDLLFNGCLKLLVFDFEYFVDEKEKFCVKFWVRKSFDNLKRISVKKGYI